MAQSATQIRDLVEVISCTICVPCNGDSSTSILGRCKRSGGSVFVDGICTTCAPRTISGFRTVDDQYQCEHQLKRLVLVLSLQVSQILLPGWYRKLLQGFLSYCMPPTMHNLYICIQMRSTSFVFSQTASIWNLHIRLIHGWVEQCTYTVLITGHLWNTLPHVTSTVARVDVNRPPTRSFLQRKPAKSTLARTKRASDIQYGCSTNPV